MTQTKLPPENPGRFNCLFKPQSLTTSAGAKFD